MNNTTLRLLVFGAVSLTALAAIGIKLLVRGDTEEGLPRQAAPAIFQPQAAPAQAPAMRTVSEVPGGDSIGMFSRTNKGYYGEEEEEAPAPSTAPAKAAAPAAAARPTAAPKKGPEPQVIPRLQAVKSFGAPASRTGSIAPTLPGGSMPDISSMIQSAAKDAQKKAGSD